jgi:hypothetical protein
MIKAIRRVEQRAGRPQGALASLRRRLSVSLLVLCLAGSGLTGCKVTYDATPDSTGTPSASAKPSKSKPSKSKPAKPKPSKSKPAEPKPPAEPAKPVKGPAGSALAALATIPVKGRAAGTGYARDEFGTAWKDSDRNGCDQRNDVLRRDLDETTLRPGTHGCVVIGGTLADPYTGKTIAFRKSEAIAVHIDHVVALQNAWVTGAFGWSEEKRTALATDPLNLLAVGSSVNESKGSGDAATWLPPRKSFRCGYVARQVAVKVKYGAWMTSAESAAIERILSTCPSQRLPRVAPIPLGKS